MKFNNAFLQKNNNAGVQFDTKQGTVTAWEDAQGIHVSEGVSEPMRAALVSKYLIIRAKVKK